jgi:hypothetical protein
MFNRPSFEIYLHIADEKPKEIERVVYLPLSFLVLAGADVLPGGSASFVELIAYCNSVATNIFDTTCEISPKSIILLASAIWNSDSFLESGRQVKNLERLHHNFDLGNLGCLHCLVQ